MSLLNKALEGYDDLKTVFSDKHHSIAEESHTQYFADRKRSWSSIYLIVASFVGSLVFIVCWVYTYISWGFWLGVFLGWIPSLLTGIVAGLVWPMVIFIAVVYLLFVQYRGIV